MKKRRVSLVLILGACLVLISLSLLVAFQVHMHNAAQQCHKIVSKMDEILPERTAGVFGIYPDSDMPVLEIDRVDYVAMLEIPEFGITLPVCDQWNANAMLSVPKRFYGSVYNHTLVVGGSDDPQQFGFCDQIGHGALVTVTDMTGAQFSYTVSRIDRAKHAQTQWLTDAGFDLTLFCRDTYSFEYIAVRCTAVGSAYGADDSSK